MKKRQKLWTDESIIPAINEMGCKKFGNEFWEKKSNRIKDQQNELEPQFRID